MVTQPTINTPQPAWGNKEVVLDVKNLRIHYETPKGDVIAVNGISFQVYKGEIVGLVGESGCGKTTAAMGILQLVQSPGRILGGEILINGHNMLDLTEAELRELRWRELSLPSIRERKPLKIITGLTHDLRRPPPGCSFQFRCPHVMDICKKVPPAMIQREPDHWVACHLYGKEEKKG